jgi:Fibronectin type III domain
MRIGLAALLVGTLGVSAVVVAAPVAASGGAPVPSQVETVTISGEFQHLAIDDPAGDDLRYAVRGADETWWLEGVTEPAPAAGSQVTVTGTAVDEYTLAVETLTVTGVASAMSSTAALAPRSTRVLVLRAFWTRRAPAQPSKPATFRKVIRGSNTWFREVSHRRYSISGVVTPWLRVPRPNDCVNGAFQIMNQALRAAQRRGFNLSRFQRAILYLPCDAGGLLGFATVPGQHVWLFNTIGLHVVVHEQGHNLGLQHASSRVCRSPQWRWVTWGPRCRVIEYGDEIDAMGNLRPGHFNGLYKARLGWLQRGMVVRSTRTVTLRPAETIGRGLKAVRVRSGRATYWVEYRTRAGYDRSMPAGSNGVQIRFQRGSRTQLLDAGPGSTAGAHEFSDTHLPAGSSWTTPQNVRIAVLRQRRFEATVAIRYRTAAKAPGRPGPVRVQALDDAARITWTRPADNGSIIRHYVIIRNDGAVRTIRTFAGLRRSYVWPGLAQSQTYRFAVRAVNQIGRSPAAASPPVRPR